MHVSYFKHEFPTADLMFKSCIAFVCFWQWWPRCRKSDLVIASAEQQDIWVGRVATASTPPLSLPLRALEQTPLKAWLLLGSVVAHGSWCVGSVKHRKPISPRGSIKWPTYLLFISCINAFSSWKQCGLWYCISCSIGAIFPNGFLTPSFFKFYIFFWFWLITCISLFNQLTETQSESSYYSPQKVKSREVLCIEQEGITIEVRLNHHGLSMLTVLGELIQGVQTKVELF